MSAVKRTLENLELGDQIPNIFCSKNKAQNDAKPNNMYKLRVQRTRSSGVKQQKII